MSCSDLCQNCSSAAQTFFFGGGVGNVGVIENTFCKARKFFSEGTFTEDD